MIIREAVSEDQKAIINVLKASLGESSSKKNDQIWSYKHVENPFGKSLVLVAESNGEIIGVRAFMKWNWRYNNQDFLAYRAVDTATHPAHQGKGIFKKLTLAAIDEAKKDSGSFIFNTPNQQSKPGYLKMGWKVISRIKLSITPTNPYFWKFKHKEFHSHKGFSNESLSKLLLTYNQQKSSQSIFTPKSVEYLKWRYIDNPIQEYFFEAEKSFCVVAYIKKQSHFKELRVVEYIYNDENGKRKANILLKAWVKKTGAHYISRSTMSGLIKGGFGPELTFRELNVNRLEESVFLNISNWDYTLGDLELF